MAGSATLERLSVLRTRLDGKDRGGQVSFAVIAIVLLIASATTGTVLAKREIDENNRMKRERLLDSMEQSLVEVVNELELVGASRAQHVVSEWEDFPVNESRISEAFSASIMDYIAGAFPRTRSGFAIGVSNWSGGLFFVEMKTMDLVMSDETKQSELEMDGQKVAYSRPSSASSETLGERTTNPYYLAIGNFMVNVSRDEISLSRESSFLRPVVSALPLLESKLRLFESASQGEFSDLGKLVGYMLSTLGELRIIEGYGQPIYSDGHNTSMIVTEQDVYRAVLVALLLEQARLFRSVDGDFASQVSAIVGTGEPGMSALLGSKGRYLDPAELFLWFLGKTKPILDPEMIIAQAVFGIHDQLVLKIMDYMGWLGVLDTAKGVLDGVRDSLDSFVSYLTGDDKAKMAVESWVEKTIAATGADPVECTLVMSDDSDFSIWIPERQYFVEDSIGDLYPIWIGNATVCLDVPEYDLLSSELWRDFYADFKECQTSFRGLVTDSVLRLAFDIASAATVEIAEMVPDPTDGKDIFQSLASSSGQVDVGLDLDRASLASREMPMFNAEYELARRFQQFVSSRGLDLIDIEPMQQAMYDNLVLSALSNARYAYIPNLVVPVEQQLKEIVRADLEADSAWGLGASSSSALRQIMRQHLNTLAFLVNISISKSDGGFMGGVADTIANFLLFGADEFPGLEAAIEQQLTAFVRGILGQREFSGFADSIFLDLVHPFEFWDGDRDAALARGTVQRESLSVDVLGPFPGYQPVPYDPSIGVKSLDELFPVDDMLIMVQRPWQFDRSQNTYPNLHLTSLTNISSTPFTSQWTVSVVGLIEIGVASNNSAIQSLVSDGSTCSRAKVRIEFSVPIVLHSGWSLQGVEYNPSNTAVGDMLAAAKRFCDMLWEKLEPIVGWVKHCFEKLFRFLDRVFEVMSSYATRVVKAAASVLQTLVENLQEFVQKIADSALGKAVKAFIDIYGRVEIRISLHGFLIVIQTDLPDLLYRHGKDLLRLTVSTQRFGPGISFGVRVARLTDGSYDILANGTLVLKKATVDVAVDPLMHILRRFVEVHCVASKWRLDLVMPEVEPYDVAEVSTADLPGIGTMLSNIPIPVLGLSADIEAGLRLKYSQPFPTDIVINEFESNPHGEDSGHEWVELYNPFDKAKSLDGWRLSTLHGESQELDLAGTIAGNGLLVFTFPETSIDNGAPGDPFNDGDAIVLFDPEGATVDVTPVLRDNGDDSKTNQRTWDGGPRWIFQEGSRGGSNGAPVLLASSDFIAKALFQAFKDAFIQTQLQEVTASLDFVVLFSKRVLNNFIENLISLVGEIIHEVIFYVKVVVSDASGSAGVGLRASFVVTGESIVQLLRWVIHSIATFIVNLGRANNPISYPAFPMAFFSGLYLRFEILFEVGLPRMVRLLGAVGPLDKKFSAAVAVSPNIPALGRLVGRNWGSWSIDFGLYLEGVPKEFVRGFISDDTGDLVDLWLAKGRIYGA
jgi:hypothetical protein